jgi:cytochrome bd ubiquinol oxidase subunit I
MFLPLLANSLGWIVAEMGRQPWVVYGLMLTRDGISPKCERRFHAAYHNSFTLVYGLLAAVAVYLVHRFAKPGVPEDEG